MEGNFAILAHEVVHAICENHDLNLHDSPYRELLADEYAVRMMKLWAGHPAFEQLLEGYQAHVLGGLRMAVPAKIRLELPRGDGGISSLKDLRDYCAKAVFPRDLSTASYVSLQLDRQRFLFEAAELEPLSGFLKAERARRPVRHWVNDEILLETLADGDVPPWLLVEGDPCGFWVVSEDDLMAMVAESVGLEEPAGLGSLKADKTTVWTMAGPGRSLLYIYRDGVLSEAPRRLIEFRRNEQGRITARVLAISAVKPSYFPHLYTDENSVALSFAEYGKNGIVRRWWDLHSSKKQLVAGRIDGLLYKALPKDGKLAEMGSLRGRMAIRDEAILFSTGDRIRLVDDGMIKTLAGDIRGLRDGRGAANVRLAGVELLGFDGGDLYLRSEGKSGPSFRRLKWSR